MYTYYTQHRFRNSQSAHVDAAPQPIRRREEFISQGLLRRIERLKPIGEEQLLQDVEEVHQAKLDGLIEGCARMQLILSMDEIQRTVDPSIYKVGDRFIKHAPRVERWFDTLKRPVRGLSADDIRLVKDVTRVGPLENGTGLRRTTSHNDDGDDLTEDEAVMTGTQPIEWHKARRSIAKRKSPSWKYDASSVFVRARHAYLNIVPSYYLYQR